MEGKENEGRGEEVKGRDGREGGGAEGRGGEVREKGGNWPTFTPWTLPWWHMGLSLSCVCCDRVVRSKRRSTGSPTKTYVGRLRA